MLWFITPRISLSRNYFFLYFRKTLFIRSYLSFGMSFFVLNSEIGIHEIFRLWEFYCIKSVDSLRSNLSSWKTIFYSTFNLNSLHNYNKIITVFNLGSSILSLIKRNYSKFKNCHKIKILPIFNYIIAITCYFQVYNLELWQIYCKLQ